MSRILLVNPKRPKFSHNSALSEWFEQNRAFVKPWYTPSLALLSIAGATPQHHSLHLIDEDFDTLPSPGSFDIVGITAMTQQATRAYAIAEVFRRHGVHVVMGGIHASVMPDEVTRHVDTVFVGEAERTWPAFLADFYAGNPRPVYADIERHDYDLSTSPQPRYELLSHGLLDRGPDYFNMLPIQATRGCPRACSFCSVSKIYGRRLRRKPPMQVAREVAALCSCVGNRLLVFVDDNLFSDIAYARELIAALWHLRVKWFAQTDIGIASQRPLLAQAYQAGCVGLLVGLESLDTGSLHEADRNNWKMRQRQLYDEAVDCIQQHGIIVHASFVFGFDHDTPASFSAVRKFMMRHKCSGQFTILTPLPGTQLYEQLRNEGRIPQQPYWDRCSFFDAVYQPRGMTCEELEQGLLQLYREVFNAQIVVERMEHMKALYRRLPPRWTEMPDMA